MTAAFFAAGTFFAGTLAAVFLAGGVVGAAFFLVPVVAVFFATGLPAAGFACFVESEGLEGCAVFLAAEVFDCEEVADFFAGVVFFAVFLVVLIS